MIEDIKKSRLMKIKIFCDSADYKIIKFLLIKFS